MLLKKILLCFVRPLNLKVYRSHYEYFDGEFLTGACTVCSRKWQSWEWTAAWSCKCALQVWKGPLPVALKTRENPDWVGKVKLVQTTTSDCQGKHSPTASKLYWLFSFSHVSTRMTKSKQQIYELYPRCVRSWHQQDLKNKSCHPLSH